MSLNPGEELVLTPTSFNCHMEATRNIAEKRPIATAASQIIASNMLSKKNQRHSMMTKRALEMGKAGHVRNENSANRCRIRKLLMNTGNV